MFNFFKKKEEVFPELQVNDNTIIALADGELMPVENVSDPMFAEKMMGDSIAFRFEGKKTLCSPANGVLGVLFPTGHAFGIVMENGVELLVHIGVDTVKAKGEGFELLAKKQGDTVKAGDPIVKVDFDKLGKKYDMSTMLIVTNPNDFAVELVRDGKVSRGTDVGTVK
ncbi:MAG: PTS glucose transporter subunit IIA [Erysipelotrichales bacterium]|nr:PTS glucose transporter subunit IIA [Erysipelotrichales bacterium]MBQ4375561.1 PTS glucose transporter subunit IIA [Erysipelotrichales bacterium]